MLPKMDIWMLSNGVMRMDVHGMNCLVFTLLQMGISIYGNGVVKMDVNGASLPAKLLKEKDISMHCNGVSKMDANAKYVVNMGIWIDGLFMELRQYIYIYLLYI
jgi:hypothetical protein